jgi:hypothetical protein
MSSDTCLIPIIRCTVNRAERGTVGVRNMKSIWRALLIIAPAGLVLGACAGTNTACQNPTTPDQVLDCSNDHFTTTVVEGTTAGAVLGGAAGYFLSGSSNPAQGILTGAVLGGAIGTAAGYAVARNNFEQQHTEQNLNALIDSAHQDAVTAQQAAVAARQRAADAQARILQLTAQYRSGAMTSDNYQAELASYRRIEDKTKQMIDNVNKRAAEIRQDAAQAGSGSPQLEQQARALDAAKADLTQSYNDMAQALAGA